MGNIADQLTPALLHLLQLGGHGIEMGSQLSQFIAAADSHTLGKVAFGYALAGSHHVPNRPGDPAADQETCPHRSQHGHTGRQEE